MHETVKQFFFRIKIISSVYLMKYVFNLLLKCGLGGLVSGIPFHRYYRHLKKIYLIPGVLIF